MITTGILEKQGKYLSLYNSHTGFQAHLHDINLMVVPYALISNIQGCMKAAFKVKHFIGTAAHDR